MTTSILAQPLVSTISSPVKRKRVLLVDGSATKRELRADTMRKLGMDVDCAADISEARSWWRAALYNLVLIDVDDELGHREKFCQDVRGATPPQSLAFLVGEPGYLADLPNGNGVVPVARNGDQLTQSDVAAALSADVSQGSPQRWGIMEASRRISAVRSLAHARTRAIRERPIPPRDAEIRTSKRAIQSRTLDDLLKEEMQ
jgi:CheY-like chemotaxis protein